MRKKAAHEDGLCRERLREVFRIAVSAGVRRHHSKMGWAGWRVPREHRNAGRPQARY